MKKIKYFILFTLVMMAWMNQASAANYWTYVTAQCNCLRGCEAEGYPSINVPNCTWTNQVELDKQHYDIKLEDWEFYWKNVGGGDPNAPRLAMNPNNPKIWEEFEWAGVEGVLAYDANPYIVDKGNNIYDLNWCGIANDHLWQCAKKLGELSGYLSGLKPPITAQEIVDYIINFSVDGINKWGAARLWTDWTSINIWCGNGDFWIIDLSKLIEFSNLCVLDICPDGWKCTPCEQWKLRLDDCEDWYKREFYKWWTEKKDEICVKNCDAYTLPRCPDKWNCSQCDWKWKLDSCDEWYSMEVIKDWDWAICVKSCAEDYYWSGDYCVDCRDYELSTCPANWKCEICDNWAYRLDSCDEWYTMSLDKKSCIKDESKCTKVWYYLSNGKCIPCTNNKPANSKYTTNWWDKNACEWICDEWYTKSDDWESCIRINPPRCIGFDLSSCPTGWRCAECNDGEDIKYKLEACDERYTRVGNACVSDCEDALFKCPDNWICSECDWKWRLDDCAEWYTKVGNECVYDCKDYDLTYCPTNWRCKQCDILYEFEGCKDVGEGEDEDEDDGKGKYTPKIDKDWKITCVKSSCKPWYEPILLKDKDGNNYEDCEKCEAWTFSSGEKCEDCEDDEYSWPGAEECEKCTNTIPINAEYASDWTNENCPWKCKPWYYPKWNTCEKCTNYKPAAAHYTTTHSSNGICPRSCDDWYKKEWDECELDCDYWFYSVPTPFRQCPWISYSKDQCISCRKPENAYFTNKGSCDRSCMKWYRWTNCEILICDERRCDEYYCDSYCAKRDVDGNCTKTSPYCQARGDCKTRSTTVCIDSDAFKRECDQEEVSYTNTKVTWPDCEFGKFNWDNKLTCNERAKAEYKGSSEITCYNCSHPSAGGTRLCIGTGHTDETWGGTIKDWETLCDPLTYELDYNDITPSWTEVYADNSQTKDFTVNVRTNPSAPNITKIVDLPTDFNYSTLKSNLKSDVVGGAWGNPLRLVPPTRANNPVAPWGEYMTINLASTTPLETENAWISFSHKTGTDEMKLENLTLKYRKPYIWILEVKDPSTSERDWTPSIGTTMEYRLTVKSEDGAPKEFTAITGVDRLGGDIRSSITRYIEEGPRHATNTWAFLGKVQKYGEDETKFIIIEDAETKTVKEGMIYNWAISDDMHTVFTLALTTTEDTDQMPENPWIKIVWPTISYELGEKYVRYYLEPTTKWDVVDSNWKAGEEDNDPITTDNWEKFIWVRVVWWLQAIWNSTFTGQEENISTLSSATVRAEIRKNAYVAVKNMTSKQTINGVYYRTWDVKISEIPSNSEIETIVVEKWNLIIDQNILARTDDKLFWIVVLQDGYDVKTWYDGNWNVYITPDVTEINAVIYADWWLISVKDDTWERFTSNDADRTYSLNKQLIMKGSLFTRNTIGWAVLSTGAKEYMLPGGVKTSDLLQAMQYDLNYVRRWKHECGTSGCYEEPFIIEYNSKVATHPPKLFSY